MLSDLQQFGSGPPLVLVPGIQGRWEYARPAAAALARHFTVITFSLCGEPTSGLPFDPSRGFDNYLDQIRSVIHRSGAQPAVVCGISFGGLAAVRFAARHPEFTQGLVLASTPGPKWHLRPRHRRYAQLPRLFGPFFFMETPFRLHAELRTAFPNPRERRRFTRAQLRTLLEAPLSPARMATRALLIETADVAVACARITRPTLVVTGEPRLDHVVAGDGSGDYAQLIPGARRVVLEGTGHLGTITKPALFATLVHDFFAPQHRQATHGPGGTRSEVA